MAFDLSKDYLYFTSPKTVTYYVRTNESFLDTGVTINYVQRSAAEGKDELDLLQNDRAVFHLWKDRLSGIVPTLSDRIKDEQEETWNVEVVKLCDMDDNGYQRYRCECSKIFTTQGN